jgi:phosphatidylinositol-3-phosphatase
VRRRLRDRAGRAWLAGLGILALATGCGSPPSPATATSSTGAALAGSVSAAPAVPSTGTASTTVPTPDHVVVVMFENKDVGQVLGSSQAPFLNQLAQTGASFTNAQAETHPSQPNYLALFTGTTHGVTDDSCLPALTGPNLATQLQTAGHSFVGYSESLPRPGFTGCRSGEYAQKHSPWAAFSDLAPSTNQPWSAWPASFDQLPTVAFVTPNLCDDMHDCPVEVGDQWLRQNLSAYANWAPTHNSLLVVTFDESESTQGANRIPTVIVGAKVPPGQVGEPVNHYRLLGTIEAMYHLPPLGHAADMPPITDIWTS